MIVKHKLLCMLLAFCFFSVVLTIAGITANAKGIPSLWDGTVDTSWYDAKSPKKEYTISTAPQLAGLAELVNQGISFESTDILLNSDLDLAGHSWVPIGNQLESNPDKPIVFSGSFDGNGHVISNLTIGSQSSPYEGTCTGLFGAVSGHISNLSLENASVFFTPQKQGEQTYGASAVLCAYLTESGSIDHCLVADSSLSAVSLPTKRLVAAGSIAGICYGKISSVSVREGRLSDPNGYGTTGGLCGAAGPGAVLELCSFSGEIAGIQNAVSAAAGGFAGAAFAETGKAPAAIRRSYAQGAISGGTWSGGFIGNSANVLIENCYTAANVKNAVYGGGFLGVGGDAASAGAIANSYAVGQVSDSFLYGGAFTGSQKESFEKISNCYYLPFSSLPEINPGPAAKSADFFKMEDFVVLLNQKNSGGIWTMGKAFPYCGAEPADYTKVEQAAASVPVDLNPYTEESVAALKQSIDLVLYGCTLAEQTQVDAMAQAIQAASSALALRPADYMLVEEALSMIPKDLSRYTQESVEALTAAIEAVPQDQTVLSQAKVDLAAQDIEQAVISLIPLDGGLTVENEIQQKDSSRPETGDFSLLPLVILLVISSGLLWGLRPRKNQLTKE